LNSKRVLAIDEHYINPSIAGSANHFDFRTEMISQHVRD
jgi:hypothetical protein